MQVFLQACELIDWQHEPVRALAARVVAGRRGFTAITALFEWVRDSISHTADVGSGRLTLRASEVLREGTGLCYAKSHLLVALLRAQEIPAGLCYQRFRDGASFVLHGLVAVHTPDGFLRIDPRGNKPGVNAQLVPGHEALAFPQLGPEDADLPGVFARPLPEVVQALSAASHWRPTQTALPDVPPHAWPAAQAAWRSP